jgi:trk system potassium uptake protein
MKVIVVGVGEVGFYLADIFSRQGHDVTVIEESKNQSQRVDEELDVKVLQGNGSSAGMLERAGVKHADFVLALTSNDRTNIICCSLAKALKPSVTTVARVHDATWTDHSIINYQLHFGIDHLLNPEALCAVELAKEIRNPGRVAVENFARGKIEVQQVEIKRANRYTGRPLREVHLPDQVRVASVRSNHGRYEIAHAESILHEGDVVTLFGVPDSLQTVIQSFDPSIKLNQARIVLFGGSDIAVSLIRLLSSPRFKIRVIEKDPELCHALADRFPEITVIRGDATSRRLLEEEHIGSCDYFVACTNRDEDNIMTSVQASKLGARHVQLVINKPDYEPILSDLKESLGVELIVSPRLATANELNRVVTTDAFTNLAVLSEGNARLIEVRVSHQSAAAGKKVRELPRSSDSVFIAILHKYDAKVPSADDTILPGDRVVVLTNDASKQAVLDLLT